MTKKEKPLIFSIEPCSFDNGPGLRNTIFLKGCSLNCTWCHNPESISSKREIAFYFRKCIGCGDCKRVCNDDAINLNDNKRIIRDKWARCGKCTFECPTKALEICGIYYSPDELFKEIMKDITFIKTSSGGVTFSGGEPFLYSKYLISICTLLKEKNIHIAIQTSGNISFELIKPLLPLIDLIYFDLKFIDSKLHKQHTGSENKLILDNFNKLLKEDVLLIPRTPLVPGITDSKENISDIITFLKELEIKNHVFLDFNSSYEFKKDAFGY